MLSTAYSMRWAKIALLLLMFRHGLRVSEACGLKLDQVDTESRILHLARLKGGLSTLARRQPGCEIQFGPGRGPFS
jgi:integrase